MRTRHTISDDGGGGAEEADEGDESGALSWPDAESPCMLVRWLICAMFHSALLQMSGPFFRKEISSKTEY
jgi:hypothetical protein